jgi:DNA-binding GntR family transcriptional regulator
VHRRNFGTNKKFSIIDFAQPRHYRRAMSGLRRATLAEQAYEELQSRIVTGRLHAGQRLLAEELASQLDISQTPVKEALVLLERDGLVEGASRRASVVRRFSAQDVADIYEARILLETHCATSGVRAGRADSAFIAELQAIFDAQIAHAQRGNTHHLAKAIRLDRAFHEALVSLGGNAVIAGWHRVLLHQTQTIRSYSLERYDVARARAEHAAIVTAIVTGIDGGTTEAIAAAIHEHLRRSLNEMLSRPPDELPPRP